MWLLWMEGATRTSLRLLDQSHRCSPWPHVPHASHLSANFALADALGPLRRAQPSPKGEMAEGSNLRAVSWYPWFGGLEGKPKGKPQFARGSLKKIDTPILFIRTLKLGTSSTCGTSFRCHISYRGRTQFPAATKPPAPAATLSQNTRKGYPSSASATPSPARLLTVTHANPAPTMKT